MNNIWKCALKKIYVNKHTHTYTQTYIWLRISLFTGCQSATGHYALNRGCCSAGESIHYRGSKQRALEAKAVMSSERRGSWLFLILRTAFISRGARGQIFSSIPQRSKAAVYKAPSFFSAQGWELNNLTIMIWWNREREIWRVVFFVVFFFPSSLLWDGLPANPTLLLLGALLQCNILLGHQIQVGFTSFKAVIAKWLGQIDA